MPEKPEPDFSTSQPVSPEPEVNGGRLSAPEGPPMIGPFVRPERPQDPEDLLRSLLRQRRGRHKIYVGAAPGVGKTYRALQELRERLAEGQDVLIGHLETHNRHDVKAIAEGIPFFPRKAYEAGGIIRTDLDLDGLLERKPQVVFVDELAHSNVTGARHKKRFIDVDELLNAGINVISTVNIQHLESLNDLVSRLTGVRVKEKIPDRVILEANEVVLVDISPVQLQERLRAGKIFAPDKVEQALTSFFTEETLTNLRELALRQVAEAVEEAPAAEETLGRGVRERIAVAVSGDPNAARLIRRGARIAQRLNGAMLVVHVRHRNLDPDEEATLAAHEELTKSLEGKWFSVPAQEVARALIAFVREHDVNQMILGESHKSRLDEFLRGSIIHEVLRRTHEVDVYVIADDD